MIDGTRVEGILDGYLARIIQHEIDHLNGILFTSKVPEDRLISMEEYWRVRDAKLAQ